MGNTASLFHFDEVEGLQPHDVAGGLDDLVVGIGFTEPVLVPGIFGRARQFPHGSGYNGLELTANQLRLRRDCSIEAIASVESMMAVNGRHTIVARGLRGSIAERRLFALSIDVSGAPSAPVAKLVMSWDQGTAPAFVPGIAFQLSSPGFVYLVATRQWLAPDLVLVSYFVNGVALGAFTVSGGAIVDGDGGHVTVGMEGAGPGVFTNYYLDAIDDLRISSVVRTPEEIETDYLRMFQWQPQGVEALRAFALSMGDAYSRDPASRIQRELAVHGDGLGFAWAQLEELLENYLPDRATRLLPRWEAICGIQPGPRDTYQQRRNRILAFMRQIAGYSVDQIVKAVAPVLACQPSDLTVIENTNTGLNPEVVWIWFIFRDPSVPGSPDVPAAQRIIDQMRPAHTLGVVGQSRNFLCDDPFSLTDRDILGE